MHFSARQSLIDNFRFKIGFAIGDRHQLYFKILIGASGEYLFQAGQQLFFVLGSVHIQRCLVYIYYFNQGSAFSQGLRVAVEIGFEISDARAAKFGNVSLDSGEILLPQGGWR